MRRFFLGFALLAATALPAAVRGDESSDNALKDAVYNRLLAEKEAGHFKGCSFDLEVESGMVWFSGRTATETQRALALKIATTTPGVEKVSNDIVVQSPPKKMAKASPRRAVAQASDVQTVETTPAPIEVDPSISYYNETPRPMARPATRQPVRNARPVAFSRARPVSYNQQAPMGAGVGQPVPMNMGGQQPNMVAAARYDHPQMPGYSWPAYAAYPNYAAVQYPRQYSPTAWPYIGPFYPYPQAPLGWRKVALEWKDGWWFLDFKDRYSNRH